METKKTHLDIPLAEMQQSFKNELAGIDSMKTAIRAIFGSASLIVSLIGALQLITAPVPKHLLPTYQMALIGLAVLYLILIAVCVAGMWPVKIYPVLPYDWDRLTVMFKDKSDVEMQQLHLSQTLHAMEDNRPLVDRLYKLQIAALVVTALLVLLILFLAFLPRV
jgi:Na+/melibiose symporter-like transporter